MKRFFEEASAAFVTVGFVAVVLTWSTALAG
jgi:hypothetical protein